MTSTFLTAIEVEDLTHYWRPTAQIRALQMMGIAHWVRCDGTPAILRSTIEVTQPTQGLERSATTQPDWAALSSAAVNSGSERRLATVSTISGSNRQ